MLSVLSVLGVRVCLMCVLSVLNVCLVCVCMSVDLCVCLFYMRSRSTYIEKV